MKIAAIPRDWHSLCYRKRTNIASCSQRRWCLSMSGYNHEILSGEAAGWYQGLTQQHVSFGGVKLVDCQWLTCNTRVRQLSSSNSITDDVILSDRLKNSKVLLILFIWTFSRCLGILIKAMNVDYMVVIREHTQREETTVPAIWHYMFFLQICGRTHVIKKLWHLVSLHEATHGHLNCFSMESLLETTAH